VVGVGWYVRCNLQRLVKCVGGECDVGVCDGGVYVMVVYIYVMVVCECV
jgi:hypothetical protein